MASQVPFRKRNQINRMESERRTAVAAQGGPASVEGQFMVSGTGEAVAEIHFPVGFIEKPLMFFGWELGEGVVIEDNRFPQFSAFAHRWITREPDGGQGAGARTYYIGVEISCTSKYIGTGSYWLNWLAKGKAITNPLSGVGDITTSSRI